MAVAEGGRAPPAGAAVAPVAAAAPAASHLRGEHSLLLFTEVLSIFKEDNFPFWVDFQQREASG